MKKGNISVIASFIIVAILIGLVVYALMHKIAKEDPLEGIKGVNEAQKVSDKEQSQAQTQTSETLKKEEKPTQQKTMDTNTKKLNNFTPVSKVSSLQKIDLVVGTGAEVKAGATVSVHYTGAVAATGAIFQSSKDFGTEPVTFPLSGVIKGWTDGIPGMKIGGTRRLIIPADLAYGANPPSGSGIPANADLVFDVELVAIK
ncbi:MAG: FKBP-type peptidyl-prolyl cis-trans isomerase [Candidatus Paceibacterota bacterium]|jgi:FKBP-type peptidyl-prolyl cis-trans isomerase